MPKSKATVGKKTGKSTQHGRDVYVTEDGSKVSEISVTVPVGDKWYNAPSIYDGVQYREDEVQDMISSGKIKPTSTHDSLEDALDAAKARTDNIKYAKGGDTMINEKKLFAEGGMMDDSGEVVGGVEVPVGSLSQEVADDIPARLSEGEFVVPADVVRFIGLEKLMAMRDKAKAGLQRMEEMGQVGNAQEVEDPDQLFSDEPPMDEDLSSFEAEIDSIMAEDMPQFANGGDVANMSLPEKSYEAAPLTGFTMQKYYNQDGQIKYIPTLNGSPLLPVPAGFSLRAPDGVEVEDEKTTTGLKETPVLQEPAGGLADAPGGETPGGNTPTGSQPSGGLIGTVEGLPGSGINVNPVSSVASAASAVANNPVGKAVLGVLGIPSNVVSSIAEYGSNTVSEAQLDAAIAAAEAVAANNVVDSGAFSFAQADGGIGTISTTASIAAQNEAVFGGSMDADGNFSPSVNVDDADEGYGGYDAGSVSAPATNAVGVTSAQNAAISSMGDAGGDSGGDSGGGGFGSPSGADGASVGAGGEARGGFISPKTSAKRRAAAKKGLASKQK